jgi:hypothetical protein
MSFEVSPVEVWVGELEDRAGALASTLAQIMMCAGANLEFVVVRPSPDHPGRSILYLAPLTTPEQCRIAQQVGLHRAENIHALRLVGEDRPGLFAGISGTLAQADINIVGVTAAAAAGTAITYLRFENRRLAEAAANLLSPVLCEGVLNPA